MKRFYTTAMLLVFLFSLAASAQDKQNGATKIDPLPRDLEIQLALSALPPRRSRPP